MINRSQALKVNFYWVGPDGENEKLEIPYVFFKQDEYLYFFFHLFRQKKFIGKLEKVTVKFIFGLLEDDQIGVL